MSKPAFPRDSVRREDVQLSAWLCSMSGYGEEDTGWSVDRWDCDIIQRDDGDHIRVVLRVAVGGKGARLNRIGYSWTAFAHGA